MALTRALERSRPRALGACAVFVAEAPLRLAVSESVSDRVVVGGKSLKLGIHQGLCHFTSFVVAAIGE